MLLRYSKEISINIDSRSTNNSGSLNVVFLHGFTGSSLDWYRNFDLVSANTNLYAVDIIGHGKSSSPRDITYYTTKSIVDQIHFVITSLKLFNVVLVGYSMGGRLSLAFMNEYPERIKGLVLESTSPGIVEIDKRDQRYQDDLELARMIDNSGIGKFIDYWLNIPLFETQKKLGEKFITELKNTKLRNNPIGIANSLRGFSPGIMPHFWNNLSDINCKTILLTGNIDKKFTDINKNMSSLIKEARHIVVDNCGHNIHLENPEIFFNNLNTFLTEL